MADAYVQGGGIGNASTPILIRTDGRSVLGTGTVLSANGTELEFGIADLQVALAFETVAGAGIGLRASSKGPKQLQITLRNFNNPLGTATTEPLMIGTLMGRPLYVAFAAYAFPSSSLKIIHYTFSLGEAS